MEATNTPSLSLAQEVAACLALTSPKSFTLKAGAGAGKTRALVETLQELSDDTKRELSLRNRKIAVITYTNAASEEIIGRIHASNIVQVSTIHSFIWGLIKHYQQDIKEWMIRYLLTQAAEARAKITPKSRRDYESDAKAYEEKAKEISTAPAKFVYSPNGANLNKNSLQHGHVLKMGADFLGGSKDVPPKKTMCEILIARFPIVLIDECQDTQKNLMQAFLHLQKEYHERFSIGLFGDAMQRIYLDGLDNLYESIPASWNEFKILDNNRSPQRIIDLINIIRRNGDGLIQNPGKNRQIGVFQFFVADRNKFESNSKRIALEQNIANAMAKITNDDGWKKLLNVKRLTLEHKMAARRDNFIDLVECFDKLPRSKQNLFTVSSGDNATPEISEIAFFTHRLMPLVDNRDEYFQAGFLKKYSQFFDRKRIRQQEGKEVIAKLAEIRAALEDLLALFDDGKDPYLEKILESIAKYNLFYIPERLRRALKVELPETDAISSKSDTEVEEDDTDDQQGWIDFLNLPFSQIRKYYAYFSGVSSFGTHQGVKGLQFDRVMVVIDDQEARGNSFHYARLFDSLADTIESTEQIERTRRLFYVVCSRSKKDLVVLCYADDAESMKKKILNSGLCCDEEIQIIT